MARAAVLPLPARLSAFYFSHFFHGGGFLAYFPLYLAWRGFAAMEIASILALPQLARIVAPAAWAALADRTGARARIVSVACAATAVCFAALPFAPNFGGVAVLVGLTSLVSCAALPLVEAITLEALADRPARYGPIRMWGSIGFIIAVLAGGAWLDRHPVSVLPWVLLAVALVALLAALHLPSPGVRLPERRPVPLRLSPAARALIAAGFLMAAAHGVLYAFLSLHLERIGYSPSAIGVLWTLGVVAEILVFLFLPALFRRYALSVIVFGSFACAVARFLVIAWLAQNLALLVLAQLMHAATFGAFHAASVAAVQRVFPHGAAARGQALFSSLGNGAGGAAGSLVGGWLWQVGGAPFAFSFAALAALCGMYLSRSLSRAM